MKRWATTFFLQEENMKPTTIDDLYTYSFLGNLKSRDQTAIFVKAVANETDNTYDQVLYQWKNGTVRPLTSFGQESNFAFLDDDTIVFCGNRKKREGKTSIYELSLQGGEAQEIATLDFDNAQIAGCLGDGTLVLLIREDGQSNETDYEVFDEIPFYVNGAGITNKKRAHLYLWKEGELTSLTSPLFDAAMVKVANDQIYVVGEEWKRKSSLMPALFQVDPSQSAWTTLIEAETLSIQDFAPAKDGVYVFGSDCVRFGLNENPDLYRVGKDQPLQKLGEWGLCVGNTVGTDCACVGGNALLVHENALYFTTTVEDHVELYRFTDRFERIFVMEGTIQAFTFVDGELLLIGAKTASLQELYAVRDGGLRACTTFNDEAERWVAVPQPVEYAGFDGGRMTGYVLYPKDFDPNKTYPGILDIHGGPKTVYGTVFYHEMQLWASKGYFVFYANPHGFGWRQQRVRRHSRQIRHDRLRRFDAFCRSGSHRHSPAGRQPAWRDGRQLWRLYDELDHRAHQPFPGGGIPAQHFQLDLVFANERHWSVFHGRPARRDNGWRRGKAVVPLAVEIRQKRDDANAVHPFGRGLPLSAVGRRSNAQRAAGSRHRGAHVRVPWGKPRLVAFRKTAAPCTAVNGNHELDE